MNIEAKELQDCVCVCVSVRCVSVRVPYRMTCCRWVRLLPKTHSTILLCLSQHPFILPVKALHSLATIVRTLEYTEQPP